MNRRIPRIQTSSEKRGPRVVRAVVVKKNRRKIPAEAAPFPNPLRFDPRPEAPLPSWRLRVKRLLGVWALLLPAGVLSLGLCYLVSVRVEVMQLGYELAKETRAQAELLQENRELRVETASLRAPPRVAEVAASEFEMSVPEPSRVIVLDPGGKEIPPLPPPPPDIPEFSGGHLVE